MFKLYYELDNRINKLWLTYQDPSTTAAKRKALSLSMEELSKQQEQILDEILQDAAKQSRTP